MPTANANARLRPSWRVRLGGTEGAARVSRRATERNRLAPCREQSGGAPLHLSGIPPSRPTAEPVPLPMYMCYCMIVKGVLQIG